MHILVSDGGPISTQYESIAFHWRPVAGKGKMNIDRSNKKTAVPLGFNNVYMESHIDKIYIYI